MNGSISGLVVGQDGSVVAAASVVVAEGPGPTRDLAALSSDCGGFVLDGLAAGTYLLQAFGPRGEIGALSVAVSGGEVSDVLVVLTGNEAC